CSVKERKPSLLRNNSRAQPCVPFIGNLACAAANGFCALQTRWTARIGEGPCATEPHVSMGALAAVATPGRSPLLNVASRRGRLRNFTDAPDGWLLNHSLSGRPINGPWRFQSSRGAGCARAVD